VIVVEMHMHPGHDVSLKIVLDMGQLSRQPRHMMVVHERDRGDGLLILVPLLSDQIVPNQIANRFRAIGVVTPFDQTIEIGKKILIEGDAESRKLLHSRAYPCYEIDYRGTDNTEPIRECVKQPEGNV
jgi:hypothetical protein